MATTLRTANQVETGPTSSLTSSPTHVTARVRRSIKEDLRLTPSQADFGAAWLSYVLCLSISHPMDTMRTRWQTLGRSPMTTLRGDKFSSLYAGVATPIFAQGPFTAAVFCANEAARYFMLRQSGGSTIEDLSVLQLSIAGGVAGAGVSCIQCPLTVLRLQQQNAHVVFGRSLPVRELATNLVRAEGFRGFYRCWWLEAVSNGIGRMTYFTTYEVNKRFLVGRKNATKSKHDEKVYTTADLALFERFGAGYATSTMSWLSIYPYDIVKNKLQADRIPGMVLPSPKEGTSTGHKPVLTERYYSGFMHCVRDTYKKEGIRKGFFKGYGLTVFRSGILTGTSLPLYEWLRVELRGSEYDTVPPHKKESPSFVPQDEEGASI